VNWFPLLLIVHIGLAVALLAPSLLLPFLLRRADTVGGPPRHPVTRMLLAMQGTGSVAIGLGLALTGTALAAGCAGPLRRQPAAGGPRVASQPAPPAAHRR
jgi:hypothetical protein